MVKAINKAGIVTEFSDLVWNMLPPHKNGFTELSDKQVETKIPKEIIEFKAKKAEPATVTPEPDRPTVVESTKDDTDPAADVAIMKEYLTNKGIKFHHMAGFDKIKKLYDANRE